MLSHLSKSLIKYREYDKGKHFLLKVHADHTNSNIAFGLLPVTYLIYWRANLPRPIPPNSAMSHFRFLDYQNVCIDLQKKFQASNPQTPAPCTNNKYATVYNYNII